MLWIIIIGIILIGFYLDKMERQLDEIQDTLDEQFPEVPVDY